MSVLFQKSRGQIQICHALIEQGLNSNKVTAQLAAAALNHRMLVKSFSAADSSPLIEKAFESEYVNVRASAAYYLHILEKNLYSA